MAVVMRWLLFFGGLLATVAMVAISMRLNYLFGASLGQSAERAVVFGWVSVIADSWKALGPVFIYTLIRSRRMAAAGAAAAVWAACLLYAISSALGIAAQDRQALVSGRNLQRTSLAEVTRELTRLEGNRDKLTHHRSVNELKANINVVFAQPVMIGDRVRGTVGDLSARCTSINTRTTKARALPNFGRRLHADRTLSGGRILKGSAVRSGALRCKRHPLGSSRMERFAASPPRFVFSISFARAGP